MNRIAGSPDIKACLDQVFDPIETIASLIAMVIAPVIHRIDSTGNIGFSPRIVRIDTTGTNSKNQLIWEMIESSRLTVEFCRSYAQDAATIKAAT
jgi:hypothetical protein